MIGMGRVLGVLKIFRYYYKWKGKLLKIWSNGVINLSNILWRFFDYYENKLESGEKVGCSLMVEVMCYMFLFLCLIFSTVFSVGIGVFNLCFILNNECLWKYR